MKNYKQIISDNPCSSIIIYGCRRAGKTEVMRSLILEKDLLGDWADIIVIFCQGINNDSYKSCGVDSSFIYNSYREDVIEALLEKQKELKKEKKELLKIALVFDDILSSRKNKSIAINSPLGIEHLFSCGRHFNILCVCLTQSMKYVGMLYQNSDMVFVFPHHIRKMKDKKEFKEEILENYTKDMSVFDDCKPHQFLFIHLTAETVEWKELSDIAMISEKILKFKI